MWTTHLIKRIGAVSAAGSLVVGFTAGLTGLTSAASAKATAHAAAAPITAAADPSLLPYNFYASGTTKFTGINIDVAAALSKELGRPIDFKSVPFNSIIPGLQANRYDIALTGMFDTKAREKVIDFVDYLKDNNNFLLRTDEHEKISSFAQLCGKVVGLPAGALEISLVQAQDKTCKKDKKPTVDLKIFPNLSAVSLALLDSRVDIAPNDSATNAYLVSKNPGKLVATGSYLAEGSFAIGIPKNSTLLQPIYKAMKTLLKNGTLKKIFTKWGILDRLPSSITINHAAF
jgi:polar amino acid transport system substrate-binding protein